ncbi:MAG: TonB-dependent receptor [Chryseosolibacter sp.]
MRKHLLTLPFLLACLWAGAQDSIKVTTLREIVVSASRTEQPLIEIPRSVTVIHQDVLQRSVYQSLGELLNAQSGLYVVGANQTPGTNQNLFMRGSSSNQVAVLVDGVRITDPSTPNAAMDLSEISLANIERIEVIRGAHSTMFGGAAIGGVINLITRKNSSKGLHGDASWQGGVFGKRAGSSTEKVNISYGLKNGLYFNGSVFQQDVRGLNAAEQREANPSFTSDADDFQKTDASLKAGFKNQAWDLNISFKNARQYTEIDNGAYSDDDNNYLVFDRQLLQYHAGYNVNPFISIALLGSFNASERFYENDSSKIDASNYDKTYSTGSYTGRLQTHEVQVNYQKQNFQGVAGIGVYGEKMFFDNFFFLNDPMYPYEFVVDYDTLDTRTTTRYLFSQAAYGFGKFQLSAGVRLSNHTTAGNFLTVEINPSLTFNDLLVYGSLSTGYNAPSLYQLYDPTRSFSGYTTRGNARLDPERSISLEAGIKKEFSKGSYVTFSAYHTKVTDAIEYVYLWNGGTAVSDLTYADDRGDTYINAGEQLVSGIEVEGLVRITSDLSVMANASVLNTTINVSPEDISRAATGGNHIQLYNLGEFLSESIAREDAVRRPDFTAFTRVSYRPFADWNVGASYRYTGKRFDSGYDGSLGPYGALGRIDVDAYHLVDLDAGWQASEVIGIALKVENILGEEYREVVGFQTRGRSVYLKLTARW